MKLLVLDVNYPSETNLYGDVFAHVRVKEYAKEFDVRVVSFFKKTPDYVYEGISVRTAATLDHLIQVIDEEMPDAILVHFFQGWMLEDLIRNSKVPFIVWVHGVEALGWYRRLFNFQLNELRQFLHTVFFNEVQLYRFGKLIRFSNHGGEVTLIFVSNWMRRVAETDSLSRCKTPHIIPNPINDDVFRFQEKDSSLRKHILLIRSFDSKKYANDLAIKAILHLSHDSIFEDLSFTIYGQGRFFAKLTNQINRFPNVSVHNQFLNHVEIAAEHQQHGIFLAPTRQDAQGVSMCEAMSSGLVPITSNNTAIPEFVTDGQTGFLTLSPSEIAQRIRELYHDPERFLQMSREAASTIRQLSGIESVVAREINLIKQQINTNRRGS